MIRIDAETVQTAKTLDLNISRICEAALAQAIEEETQPYGIIESQQIFFEADLFYNARSEGLGLGLAFMVTNTSEENVILDRINYMVGIKTDDSDKTIQDFKGTVLERRIMPKGRVKEPFSESLKPSPDLVKILKETTKSDRYAKGLKWIIVADLFVDSKKAIMRGKFEQILDERGIMPRPRLINVI